MIASETGQSWECYRNDLRNSSCAVSNNSAGRLSMAIIDTRRSSWSAGIIYAGAAVLGPMPLLIWNLRGALDPRPRVFLISWFSNCLMPLILAFAYPRVLFTGAPENARRRLRLHVTAAVLVSAVFVHLAFPYWQNPFYWENPLGRWYSPLTPLLFIAISVLFLVTAIFLLVKNKSSLAGIAAWLFWPYWLLIALMDAPRIEGEWLNTFFYFTCFIAGVPLAFAAGSVRFRPRLPHISALVGVAAALPWLYMNVVHREWGNVWIMFNRSDWEPGFYPQAYTWIEILAVTFVMMASVTAAFRLLPAKLRTQKKPLRERTWPAVAICTVMLAIWFVKSVMPYRIPGAVDYAGYPDVQILHVEKRGLQFHSTLVSIASHRGTFAVSGNDRRLLQYRFEEHSTRGALTEELAERVNSIIIKYENPKVRSDTISPIRKWDEDAWYISGDRLGDKAYTSENGQTPPQEYLDLFQRIERLPTHDPNSTVMRDVCLGFCYDPLSDLGRLYENHRCHVDWGGVVCR